MCNSSHAIAVDEEKIKEHRIDKEMANTMYQDKPLLGSREEISMVKALGADNETSAKTIAANVKHIKEPQYIIYDIETDCSYKIEGADT